MAVLSLLGLTSTLAAFSATFVQAEKRNKQLNRSKFAMKGSYSFYDLFRKLQEKQLIKMVFYDALESILVTLAE